MQLFFWGGCWIAYDCYHPVDGSEIRRSPVDMVNIPIIFDWDFTTIPTVVTVAGNPLNLAEFKVGLARFSIHQ